MIKFQFTIRMLSGDFEEWKSHDKQIVEMVERHGGKNHSIKYDYHQRHIEVSYPSIDNLIRAGMEVRHYFSKLGIDQEILDVRQEKVTEEMLDTLVKLKQAVAV